MVIALKSKTHDVYDEQVEKSWKIPPPGSEAAGATPLLRRKTIKFSATRRRSHRRDSHILENHEYSNYFSCIIITTVILTVVITITVIIINSLFCLLY